jgi:hypothetical protein
MTGTDGDSTGDGTKRFPVTEAAGILGISTEATRQRIKRGTLPTERDEEGNVFVLFKRNTGDSTRTDANGTDDGTSGGTHTNANRTDDKERLIEFLRDQLREEREANRENRRIIAGLVQRVPELEPAPEYRESRETAPEGEGRGIRSQKDNVTQEKPSWWRRFFGFV